LLKQIAINEVKSKALTSSANYPEKTGKINIKERIKNGNKKI